MVCSGNHGISVMVSVVVFSRGVNITHGVNELGNVMSGNLN